MILSSTFKTGWAYVPWVLIYGCSILPAKAQEVAFKIEVNNVEVKKGQLLVAVCLENEFLRGKCAYTTVVEVTSDPQQLLVPKLPAATYAVKIGYDKNNNKKIDTNFFGAPTEPIGFSKNKVGKYGPPDFKDVAVKYEGAPLELSIDLR
jgi:uncharacterized protein (DUF2141 family)